MAAAIAQGTQDAAAPLPQGVVISHLAKNDTAKQDEAAAMLQGGASAYLESKKAAKREADLDTAAALLQGAAATHLEVKRVEQQKKADESAAEEPGLLENVGNFMKGLFSQRPPPTEAKV